MQTKRLIRKVPLREMDTVKARQKVVGKERDLALLERCEQLWMNLEEPRRQRARARRFTFGDQWGDLIEVNGKTMTQREYLQAQGNVVLQTNQIKNKVDTIVGVLVKEKNEPICNARDRDEQQYGEIMTTALQANCYKNKMEALYIDFMKDMCLGGWAIAKEIWERRFGRYDSWTDYRNPNYIFFDSDMIDPRFWDISLIGEFYDIPPEALAAKVVKNERDYALLKDIYPGQFDTFKPRTIEDATEKTEEEQLNFRTPYDTSRCRVYEVWTKETKPRYQVHDYNEGTLEIVDADNKEMLAEIDRINADRRAAAAAAGWTEDETPLIEKEFFMDTFWYCRLLAPGGDILWEGESPYADRSHPYSLCATPFIDGKICGYMNDAIDHNIAMNRTIVLQDWLTRSQAKGVTVVPKKIVPDGDMERFAKSWTSIDDMVFIDMKEGQEGLMPKVFYGAAQTYPASELINTYSRLMENSTAITGAIQGKTPYSGTSGTMYAQMAANSSTPIAALLSQFRAFMQDIHTKKMKNIAAFYEPEEFEKIAGNIDGIFDNANLNLNEVAHIEYDLAISESVDTPVHRAMINDDAKEFLLNGLITMDEYLAIAAVPYADKLLQMRQARQSEIQAAQQGEIPQQQIQQGLNQQQIPETVYQQ